MALRRACLSLLLATLAIACTSPPATTTRCLTASDCMAGQICNSGACVRDDAATSIDAGVDAASDPSDTGLDAPSDVGTDAGSDAGPTLDPTGFATRLSAVYCRYLALCTGKINTISLFITLGSFCARPANVLHALDVADLNGALYPGVDFDAAAGEACLGALESIAVSQCSPSFDFMPDACAEAFHAEAGAGPFVGTIADGGACTHDHACASGRCSETATCPGTCAPASALLGAGALCATNSACASPLVCRSGMCQARGLASDACDANDDCGADLYCGAGTCQAAGGSGAACTPASVFADDTCAGALLCLGSTCVTPGRPGNACSGSAPCEPGLHCNGTCVPIGEPGATCVDGSDCIEMATVCYARTCTLLPALGEVCHGSELPCGQGECIGGVCTLAPSGATCTNTSSAVRECTGYCDTTELLCAPLAAIGGACGGSVPCASGTRCLGGTCMACP